MSAICTSLPSSKVRPASVARPGSKRTFCATYSSKPAGYPKLATCRYDDPCWCIIAAPAAARHESDQAMARGARTDDLGRILVELYERPVGELDAKILVEQHDAFGHVVEDGLHHRPRALDVGPRRCERRLALLDLGDVIG